MKEKMHLVAVLKAKPRTQSGVSALRIVTSKASFPRPGYPR